MVYERNENDELVRNIVEKARKRKVTTLKKAILSTREKARASKVAVTTKPSNGDQKSKSKMEKANDGLSSGYVTIDDSMLQEEDTKNVEKMKV